MGPDDANTTLVNGSRSFLVSLLVAPKKRLYLLKLFRIILL